MTTETEYATCNTVLAAWLGLNGYEPASIDPTDGQNVRIVFDNDSKRLRELVRLFQLGQAEGNINDFFHNYKSIVNRVKTQINNGNGQRMPVVQTQGQGIK